MSRSERWLLHAALPANWGEATASGEYRWSTRGRTLDDEGFVHLSYPDQIDGVIERFYADLDTLVILVIDRGLLTDPVVDEPPVPGAVDHFPHLYGPIPLDAVVRTVQWSASSGVAASTAATFGDAGSDDTSSPSA